MAIYAVVGSTARQLVERDGCNWNEEIMKKD